MKIDLVRAITLLRWNRKLLIGLWGIIALSVIVETINNAVSLLFPKYPSVIVFDHAFFALCSWMLLAEAIYYAAKSYGDYIIILSGTFVSVTFIYFSPNNDTLLVTLYLPILVSVFYFQKRKVFFALGASWLSYLFLYLVQLNVMGKQSILDFISMTAILAGGAIISIGIMSRGSELVKQLQQSIESRQDLLVKTIIMDKLAKTDALTELYNHMSFHEYLDKLIEHGEKNGLRFHVALLDIDHFKKVNDSYGHRAGDIVLKRVAAAIRETISPNDFAARYGGEEFAIIFTESTLEEAGRKLEQLRIRISEEKHPELKGNPVTISVGMSTYVLGCSKEELFGGADGALYKAKNEGRNQMLIMLPELKTLTV
jgi:diguanylate cyclase (GGDEF)-like protein